MHSTQRRTLAIAAGAALLLAAASSPAAGQELRAELGRRLARFETAWQEADAATRARAVGPMEEAVRCFFSLQLGTAAKRLDEAWYAVRPEGAPTDGERGLVACAVSVSPKLADTGHEALSISVQPLYDRAGPPDGSRLRLSLTTAAGETVTAVERGWTAGPIAWATGPLPAGDLALTVECLVDDRRIPIATRGLSRVERLAERQAALGTAGAAGAADEPATATVRATRGAIADLLEGLADDRQQETDYPAARLLAFAERLAGADAAPAVAAAAREADTWLTLATPRGQVPVRVRAPAAAGALPVLFLLHGAGGSENMFFETCGAGRAVRLGLERGWLVVAPRQGMFGLGLDVDGMLEALEGLFPLDRSRVFLVGHSMGAMQTSRQVAKHPGLVAAAVGLGGGGTASKDEAARRVPWFIAAGEHDFGKRGAEALARQLEAAGSRVTYREIPDVEHMVIVQAALDDVFTFLDGVAPRAE